MKWSRLYSRRHPDRRHVATCCRSADETCAGAGTGPRGRSGSRSESQPAGLHHRQPADDAAGAAVQECVPRHAPVWAAARRRAISAISPSDFFGLDSGAQIGLEYRFGIDARRAGRHPPHEQPDDRVLRRSTTCCSSADERGARARRVSQHRRHEQLQATATRPRWASSCRVSLADTARFTSSRCG